MMRKLIGLAAAGCTLALIANYCVSEGESSFEGSQRESFDFGWSFKYFGPGDPEEDASPAHADGSQDGHPTAHAIDGDMSTRWCAADDAPGHSITLDTGVDTPVHALDIYWEKADAQNIELEITYADGVEQRRFRKEALHSHLELPGKPVKRVKITVTDTKHHAWASLYEIALRDKQGNIIPPLRTRHMSDPAQPEYAAEGFRPVQLPHDWAIESPFLADEPNETGKLPWNGYGWYRKSFDVPSSFSPKKERYYLDFDGVMAHPRVYVNGALAGEWAYGYSSFRVDITPLLKAGQKNLIAVMASNRPLSTRWYPGAGIYRHVWLVKTQPAHIAYNGVYVTTPAISEQQATVKVQTELDNTGSAPIDVTVQQSVGEYAAEPVQVTLAPGATKKIVQHITLPSPTLWSCENPHLYKLCTKVTQGERLIDSRETTFGVRTAEWRAEGFFLNGKRVPIQGVCEHHDLGALGAAFHERAFEKKVQMLKAMGCNSIRTAHNPPAPAVLDICDKYGIMVMDEIFDIWKLQKYDKLNGYHRYWPEWWKKDVANFIRRDRNHPCVIAWSGGNEVPEIWEDFGPTISQRLRDEMRKHDDTRAYTVGTNSDEGALNGFGDVQDAFGYNYRPRLYKAYDAARPDMPFYGSETASCVGTRDTYFFPLRWSVNGGARFFQVSAYGVAAANWGNCPDIEFAAQDSIPRICGEYVWTGFDYLGEPTPYNQDASNVGNLKDMSPEERADALAQLSAMGNKAPSRSSYFGIIDLAGFPKDTYYLYQSRWAPQVRQAHLLPHWNWPGREGQITPVMCFSSGDEAELFVNGKSQGVRRKGEGESFTQGKLTIPKNAYRFVWEDVVYEPGEIKVIVKKNGEFWAEATRVTTGESVAVQAQADRAEIAGDGHDLSYISLALVDEKGNPVLTDSRPVSFAIEGPAALVGFCNGNPIDQTCMQSLQQSFFNGRIMAIVRSLPGQSGTATVTIRAEGLPEVTAPITVKPE